MIVNYLQNRTTNVGGTFKLDSCSMGEVSANSVRLVKNSALITYHKADYSF